MSTATQIAANQSNAQASTGPRTEAGKSISSRNSTKHGLSAEFSVLSHENPDEFQDLLAKIFVDFEPTNDHEEYLVTLMAQARWREARCRRFENLAFELMLNPDAATAADASPDLRIVARLTAGRADALALIERYCTAAVNQYTKCYKALLHGRRIHANYEKQALEQYIRKVVYAPLPPGPVPPDMPGFVSQNVSQNKVERTPAGEMTPPKETKAAALGNLALRL